LAVIRIPTDLSLYEVGPLRSLDAI
jgi:hypothetical protein